MKNIIVLSYAQAALLLKAKKENNFSTRISPDLGLSTLDVSLFSEGILFPTGEQLDWDTIEQIALSDTKCFAIRDNEISEIKLFSDYTNRVYSLYPTSGAPTMLISGIPMHRIKGTDPYRDTLEKIKTIAPIVGRVLDTTTGLGYTAIEAAKTAEQVITIELDPAAIEIARLNPWSQALFDNPKISQIIDNSFDKIQEFKSESFSRVIHDPPMLSLAGELYSETFYSELYRVLQYRGRLFHYIGDPESKSGNTTTKGVIKRLHKVGFSQVFLKPKAFGVVAQK